VAREKWLILFTLTFIPVLALAEQKAQNNPMANITIISSQEFKGFDKCKISNKLSATLDRLINNVNPVKKEESVLTYSIKSEVMGLPAKALIIGVCNDGSRACGWGSFLAVVISKPLKEAKSQLKKRTGIDFTKEKRAKEFQVTLRPVLAEGQNSYESVIFCDPGIL